MPIAKCLIHQWTGSVTEFLFEWLMGGQHPSGPCIGCTVANQNFLKHLRILTTGCAKPLLPFTIMARNSLGLQTSDWNEHALCDQILTPASGTEPPPPMASPLILGGIQPWRRAKTFSYEIINEMGHQCCWRQQAQCQKLRALSHWPVCTLANGASLAPRLPATSQKSRTRH